MNVLDLVQEHLGPGEIQQLSQQIGADPAQTQSAVQAAVPMLLGGMASGAREPGGAQQIQAAMGDVNTLGGLGGLGGLLGGGGGGGGGLGGALGGLLGGLAGGGAGGGGTGGGILGQILGRQQPAVQDGVQQASGLNSGQVQKLLLMLAPIVLAALARKRQQAPAAAGGPDLDGDGIPDALEQEARQAGTRNPQIGGILGKILDAATRR